MTETYTPSAGDRVVIRRWEVPCPELPGVVERTLRDEHEGTVAGVRPAIGGMLLRLEGLEDAIFTGGQFTGQDPARGCSWSLVTEVIRAEDVAAHDRAQLAALVRHAEDEKARALALWERARDAEVVARQRLTGAQERLEATMRRTVVTRQPEVTNEFLIAKVAEYRRSGFRRSLLEYLGMTPEEYGDWFTTGVVPARVQRVWGSQ